MSALAGSRASASAGSPSVTRLTSRTWITASGAPSPARIATVKTSTSPRFAESRKATNLRMLSPMRRPSAIAATIVAKSSSVRTIAAASRAASVPAAAHRDADVGAAERGRVVDAVAGDRHDVAVLLQLTDERELVRGCRPREDRLVREPEGVSDRVRRGRMVAGEHPDLDAGGARCVHGRCGGGSQRVVERDHAEEVEVALDLDVGPESGSSSRAATASTRRPSAAQALAGSRRSSALPVPARRATPALP